MNSNRYFVSYAYSVSDTDRKHAEPKMREAQKRNSAVTHHQTPYYVMLNTSNPEYFYRTFVRSLYSSELDLSHLQMPNSLELFLVVLVLDAVLLLYKVTVLCMEIKGFHSGEKQADFLYDRQGTHLQQEFLTKKKEKVVSFAGLEQSSDDGSKNFHSSQDLYSEVKMTNASVYTNSFQSVRGCQRMGSILVMPSESNISRQDNVNSKLPHLLITLNSLNPYHTVAASADSEAVATRYCPMSLRCVSYFQLFWQLLRCSDAFPKAILASILFLLSGVALNVMGQNLMPEFLQSFLDLCPYKEVLNDSIHSFNRYLKQLINDSNKELSKWQQDMTTFEFKQLQGIFQFLNAGRIDRMKTSIDYICPVRVLLGLSDGVCHNSSSQVKPISTPILPCNFLEIEPNCFSETQLQSLQQNISINLINKLQNVCDLATSFCITLCLVVVFSFIFHIAISAFFRALKMQNFVPVRTFIVAKRGQNFMTSSQSCHPRSSPEQANIPVSLSENKTRSTNNPITRTESSDRSTGADDSDSIIICSRADVPSGASTSSSNFYLSASLRKFSETKV